MLDYLIWGFLVCFSLMIIGDLQGVSLCLPVFSSDCFVLVANLNPIRWLSSSLISFWSVSGWCTYLINLPLF
jgi:hypothetical protein